MVSVLKHIASGATAGIVAVILYRTEYQAEAGDTLPDSHFFLLPLSRITTITVVITVLFSVGVPWKSRWTYLLWIFCVVSGTTFFFYNGDFRPGSGALFLAIAAGTAISWMIGQYTTKRQ